MRPMVALALLAAPLTTAASRPGCPLDAPPSWRGEVTAADRDRIGHWRDSWRAALAGGGKAVAQARAGDDGLFDPDAALPDPALAPGGYRCRLMRIGRDVPGGFVAQPPRPCAATAGDGVLRFTVLDGPQRPRGRLFADQGGTRLVFLGTRVLGDERSTHRYGEDGERDLAGVLERIGTARWRLALPEPGWGATLELIDITRGE
jgi:hypothetical protein